MFNSVSCEDQGLQTDKIKGFLMAESVSSRTPQRNVVH